MFLIMFLNNVGKTIGSHDCADRGAERIAIELSSGKKHKVTFEFINEPEEKNYMEELRMQMGSSGQYED
jgi:hypothetical protein